METGKKHLLIVHTARRQALSDWEDVRKRIDLHAPDIETRFVDSLAPSQDTLAWQVTRPSLVFSVTPLENVRPHGGRIYCNTLLTKYVETTRLVAAGIPTPPAVPFTPGLRLDPAHWGEFVIVKPNIGARGENIRLVRTVDLDRRRDELHARSRRKMIVQKFVEHIDDEGKPGERRVLTVFGVEMYASKRRWKKPRRSLAELADDREAIVASNSREVENERALVVGEDDVVALARRAAKVFPDQVCLGIDVVCETWTGRLFVLDVNSGGGTWHFSSQLSAKFTAEFREGLYKQFNALDRVADMLIEKTRTEAV
jgi:hypothetical protein